MKRAKVKKMSLLSLLPRGTVNKIAEMTGVERRTVSFALKGDNRVAEETMLKIITSAKDFIAADYAKKGMVLGELELEGI